MSTQTENVVCRASNRVGDVHGAARTRKVPDLRLPHVPSHSRFVQNNGRACVVRPVGKHYGLG
jgi:hypothetical protein